MAHLVSEPWHLGNDVVDLLHPGGGGRSRGTRFLDRVCSPAEKEIISSSSDPDLALWVHWAAKEAIFKSASKALGAPPVFHHPLFHVAFPQETLDPITSSHPGPRGTFFEGIGQYRNLTFGVGVLKKIGVVHAISWCGGWDDPPPTPSFACLEAPEETRGSAQGLEGHFSSAEWECVTHRASALARINARRALARALGVSESRLEIRCRPGLPGRRIPSVWLDNEETEADLSLSHHGRFLAWAFLTR